MKIFKSSLFVIFSALLSLVITNSILADEYEKCKNSKWGADDEIGAANYLNDKRSQKRRNIFWRSPK